MRRLLYELRVQVNLNGKRSSELKPVRGIDIVGPLPPEIQNITVFSAGIATGAREPSAGQALISFLASPAAAPVLTNSGLVLIIAGQSR
jgi:molybdate transport system substrate-binding protein